MGKILQKDDLSALLQERKQGKKIVLCHGVFDLVHQGHLIHFQERPVAQLNHPKKYGFVISNPPYGERLEDVNSMPPIYKEIGEAMKRLDTWSIYLITSYADTEKYIGRKADKNRKIYNGMMKTYYYQFLGPKPKKKRKD